MNNLDCNIKNYTFDDLLNLFKLNKNFTKSQLITCKDIVNKTHPEESNLNIKYYNLFNNAYNILTDKLENDKLENDKLDNFIVNQKLNNSYNSQLSLNNSCYTPPCLFSTRLVSVHTEDRDILKYPYENNFEIELPSNIKNILSIELFDITLPKYYYNISEYLQNDTLWCNINGLFNEPIEITVLSGHYNGINLAAKLTNELNSTITNKLREDGEPSITYNAFVVSYDAIDNKITFKNINDTFTLWFNKFSIYDKCIFNCEKMLMYWGLGYNLGFYKKNYTSIWDDVNNVNYIKSSEIVNLNIYDTIYMEINTYNWIDEINPFSIATNDLYNNDYNGTVNSSFAKLILSDTLNCYIPVDKFKRVLPHIIEKQAKLKFKFRYHTGIPVDFLHQSFNFSLKFECRFNCKY
jgi:hypothetical protein